MSEQSAGKAVDGLQQRITQYASGFSYDMLTPEAIHAAKLRVVDSLGVLMGGFFTEGSAMARKVAATMPQRDGATIIGTRAKTTLDMAAFVNGTTARYIEMSDTYHWPKSAGGHPSDMIMAILAVAEHVGASGKDVISNLVLAYEIYLRISNEFHHQDFDHVMFCCLGSAIAAARLFKLTPEQMSHCVSMAIVPNASLRQARMGQQTMWRAAATGQAARAGVFAATLARAGMEGPHLPFEGKAGWCDHVARKRFALETLGGGGVPFKILDTRLKFRASSGVTQAPVMAAEKLGALGDLKSIERIEVEVNQKAMAISGAGEENTNPGSREAADHSIPFLVASTLKDGTVTHRSFNDANLWNPSVRALMKKITVRANDDFTRAGEQAPVENCARVTVFGGNGDKRVGEYSSAKAAKSAKGDQDAMVADKFRSLCEDYLGARRVKSNLDRLSNLEAVTNVATLIDDFVIV